MRDLYFAYVTVIRSLTQKRWKLDNIQPFILKTSFASIPLQSKMKYSSFLCEIALILFRNCVFLGEITAQANAESRQYHWTKYAVKGEKIISSSVSSFPSGSLQACAVLSTAFSKFSYDFEQKICYLEPTLQNSPSVNSEVHFLLTFGKFNAKY